MPALSLRPVLARRVPSTIQSRREDDMPRLQFLEGGRELFLHLLRPGRTVIGRSDRCDISLPSESVSRIHCLIERRTEGWYVQDKSRNGTIVNGVAVGSGPNDRYLLSHGDELAIGCYHARFGLAADDDRDGTTTTSPVMAAVHEELVEVSELGVAANRAELTFTRGPETNRVVVLTSSRTTIGGPGADVMMAPDLPRNALRVRVVRGRVMLEPGEASAYLAGMRVREITPVLLGEEVRVGDHAFTVNVSTVEEVSEAVTGFGEMVGETEIMRRLFGTLMRIAAHDDAVLLTGDSGTGKEVAARALHDGGPRHDQPFVALNCASIAEGLFESELFGHEKGAFTGADRRQDGAFQQAAGGTLFLDEIGEMRMDVQSKLLRALESGEIRRVGASSPEFPDVRIVAATNRSLQEMVSEGTFRGDLYFRLAVLTVHLPALKDRRADIPTLARALLARNHPDARITDDAISALLEYNWPGNVRELRNVLTRAVVMGGPVISASTLVFHPWAFEGDRPSGFPKPGSHPEKDEILAVLKRNGGNRTRTARELGMPRSTLLYKLARYGVG
jgi:two-component system response regulator HydG